ncbi:hypothetical protein CQA01_42290 [Cyclobacterium qasimii]|uniref:Uncharacterized protein n=4 Tax=Cyclobacterium qasimii TaxID=1350429 RepID=A0A512CHM5_9BACT|nr:hypothetical protein CQA01_42290 [Cyclobacterium qasimii]
MSMMQKGADDLLKQSFQVGMLGIVFAVIPLVVKAMIQPDMAYMGLFAGLGIGLQLLGLSLAVLVLRRKKISERQKEKAKKMTLILAVALLFFMLA